MARAFQHETNPGNGRPLLQRHGDRAVYFNPPAIPLEDGAGKGEPDSVGMDELYDLPFNRMPHPTYDAPDPRLRDGETQHRGHARLFRRLHLLLHHRARGPRHPEPLGGERAARGPRAAAHGGLPGHHHRPRRPHRQHVQDEVQVGRPSRRPAASSRACASRRLREPGHGPRAGHRSDAQGAGRRGREPRLHRVRRALRPGRALAAVRARAGETPRRRAPERGAGARVAARAREDEEARRRELRALQGHVRLRLEERRQGAVRDPVLHLRPPGLDPRTWSSWRIWLKAQGYRPRQVQDFIPTPMSMASSHVLHGHRSADA
jgi:hypothetical protein